MIIRDLIDHVLSNDIYKSVSVSGLDGSGKTYMMSPLVGKYDYFKTNGLTPYLTPLRFMKHYRLFDRNPIIDRWVYTNLSKSDFDYDSVNLCMELLDQYFKGALFIIYLHDKFRYIKPNEPDYVDKNRSEILKRYQIISSKMIEMGYPVILIESNRFKFNNINIEVT